MKSLETNISLNEIRKIVTALGETLAPMVEVVLHDLTDPDHAIIAISNNLSNRKIGDATTEIGLARIEDSNFPEVLQNYPNIFPDGRPAKSTSIGLKDGNGNYVAAICLNMDISMMTAAASSMMQLVKTQRSTTMIQESLSPRRIEDVRASLERFSVAHNTTPRGLNREQRQQAVRELSAQGLLDLKNALSETAQILGIARSTVYTYLPDIKRKA